jgi:hypothetical protein
VIDSKGNLVLYFLGWSRYDICMKNEVKVGSIVKWSLWVRPKEAARVVSFRVLGDLECALLYYGPSEGLRAAAVSTLEVVNF